MTNRKRSKSLPIVLVEEEEPVNPPIWQSTQQKMKTHKRSKSLPIVSVEEQEPVALQMYGQSEPLIRSPRFDTPIPQESSRTSLRLTNGEPLSGGSSEMTNKKVPDVLEIVDRKVLRSSPRFSGNANTEAALVMVKPSASSERKPKKQRRDSYFIGDPIPADEAQERWGWRYEMKIQRSNGKNCTSDDDDEDKIVSNVECHYAQARVSECIFDLGDCAFIKGEGTNHLIGKILEFFRTTDGEDYFRVQWFYRAEDTVIKEAADFHDSKRLFYSTVMNDNPVDCIISKVSIAQIPPKIGIKPNSTPSSDFYFDMEYCVEYSTFRTLLTENSSKIQVSSLPPCIETVPTTATATFLENKPCYGTYKAELALLDLYSGCGGMSTGLCLGAKLSGIDLVTRWAIDSDKSACESLKLNHPEAKVRNEAAEDFLELLKEWNKLCKRFAVNSVEMKNRQCSMSPRVTRNSINSPKVTRNSVDSDSPPRVTRNSIDSPRVTKNGIDSPRLTRNSVNSPRDVDILAGEFEVDRLVDICYGDPNKSGKRGLKFKFGEDDFLLMAVSLGALEGLRYK